MLHRTPQRVHVAAFTTWPAALHGRRRDMAGSHSPGPVRLARAPGQVVRDLSGIGEPQLAPCALIKRGPPKADDASGGWAGPQGNALAGANVTGDLPVDLDGQPPAARQD